MASAWERGERVTAAELIERSPHLDTEAAIRIIYEEICLRREAGLAVDIEETIRRFPRWAAELRDLLDCDRLLGTPGEATVFPEVGETLGPFRLLAELGRGASGRTFLATEPTLADRPVVVKDMSSDQDEHLALARLQHTHIIPLFSEYLFPARGLRVLCMPYLGGASLAQVLTAMADVAPARRSGRLIVEQVDRLIGPSTVAAAAPAAGADGPFRRFLEQASYVDAVVWVVSCLADGLHYAHARGLVHMDLKPSNVLITGDGQPMLLDFHLARGPLRPGEPVSDRLGGTPGWMSPEQQAAVEAVGEGRPVAVPVDVRSDIYALGLLLREMLVGPSTGSEPTAGSLRGYPEVSVGLADIVRKCLEPDLASRYSDVATLADDLRRHLSDLPLRGVSNRSPSELLRKWRRRQPGLVAWGVAVSAVLAAVLVAASVLWAAHHHRVAEVTLDLDEGRRLRTDHQFDASIRTLQRGLATAESVPGPRSETLAGSLTRELALAQRGRMALDLHELADLIRFHHADAPREPAEARARLRDCQAVWEARSRLRPTLDATLDAAAERQLHTDLLELAVVWADLLVKLAPPDDAAAARGAALRVLDEAENEFGPSLALDLQRRAIDPSIDPARTGPARAVSAGEHYDLGRFHLRNGHIAEAEAEFRKTLDERPQDFWPNFYQGLCAYQLRRYDDAVAAFRAAIALAPQAAPCYYNRALALDALGRFAEAYRDDTRAIELDPQLLAARLNRGIIAYKSGQLDAAAVDLDNALGLARDDATRGRVHYNLALVALARGDRAAARAHAEAAVAVGHDDARPLARDLGADRPVPPRPAQRAFATPR
jgi:serine/threonine protein kinase/tetratricopeptide (TPR) repeat protein